MTTQTQAAAAAKTLVATQNEMANLKLTMGNHSKAMDDANKTLRKYMDNYFEVNTPGQTINLGDEYGLLRIAEPTAGVALLYSGDGATVSSPTPDDSEELTEARNAAEIYIEQRALYAQLQNDLDMYEQTAKEQMDIIEDFIGDTRDKRFGWWRQLDGQHAVALAGSRIAVFNLPDDSMQIATIPA